MPCPHATEKEQQRLVCEAVECTGVEKDEALCLLRACRWDVARYNEVLWGDVWQSLGMFASHEPPFSAGV
ncbi:hypothetical protein AK812_SmicGene42923 [Symbiodinium microadriaticum]|uniref:Uncharacterized protein n=1 Tax=Symbiodinium microadriaticum TaxID=2951 RepID=A0A1Q9C2B4_SYMMI|nr:hypothetical protein AK812_SmicGene42923 [Symbiodinium microadriaticum]